MVLTLKGQKILKNFFLSQKNLRNYIMKNLNLKEIKLKEYNKDKKLKSKRKIFFQIQILSLTIYI